MSKEDNATCQKDTSEVMLMDHKLLVWRLSTVTTVTHWSVSPVLVIVSTPLQVSPIFPISPSVFKPILCLSVASSSCLSQQAFLFSAPAFPSLSFSRAPGFVPFLFWPWGCLPADLHLCPTSGLLPPACLDLSIVYPCWNIKPLSIRRVCIWVLPWFLIVRSGHDWPSRPGLNAQRHRHPGSHHR